jgi:hypothetical protein
MLSKASKMLYKLQMGLQSSLLLSLYANHFNTDYYQYLFACVHVCHTHMERATSNLIFTCKEIYLAEVK